MAVQISSYATPRMDLGQALYEYTPDMGRFITPQALPLFQVKERTSTFSKITRESLLKRADAKHANGAAYNRVDVETEDGSYDCEEYGLESVLTDIDRAMYQYDFDAELGAVQTVWNRILIEQEIRTQAVLFNTSTWTGSDLYTDNSGSPWSDTTTNVIGQVMAAMEKVRLNTGMPANALILGQAVLNELLANDDILGYFPGMPSITRAMLESRMASIFGLDRLIVGGQVYDSAAEGQDFSGTDIWGSTYVMVARVASEGQPFKQPGLGRTFLWVEDSASIMEVEQYRDEIVRGDVFRGRQHLDEVVFDKYFGHLMKI